MTRQAEHCRDYDASPAEYDAGRKTFPFDATIYRHGTVIQALIDAQHGKCCFCETRIREEGDVEHFRPKGGLRQEARARLEKPGYYWLAYDWNNLLLACSVCNQRHKKNLFPLVDPGKRVHIHSGDVSQEKPVFINPAETDPAGYIAFRKEVPYAINGNRRAQKTIKALGLRRSVLSEKRRERLDQLLFLRKVLDQEVELGRTAGGREILEEARDLLQKATLDSAEYAAMARAAAAVDFRLTLP